MSLYVSFQYLAEDRNRLIQTIGRMDETNSLRGMSLDEPPGNVIQSEERKWVSVHWDGVDVDTWAAFAEMCVEEDIPIEGWFDDKIDGDHNTFFASGPTGYEAIECDDQLRLPVYIDDDSDYNLPLWRFVGDDVSKFMKGMREVRLRVRPPVGSKKEELPESNGPN